MTFTIRPAKRADVKLVGGLAGPSGGGKSLTALLLARGLAGPKGKIVYCDSEHGRSQMYADIAAPWDWLDFQPPFSPERYLEVLKAAEAEKPDVIVLDSISHEFEGEGGLHDIVEDFLRSKAGDDARKRAALSFQAWAHAKQRHKKLLLHILRMPCHLLLAMRAADKIELVKDGGQLKAVPKRSLTGLDGWEPICERRLPYEMTFSYLLLPDRPGVPRPLKPMPDSMAPLVSLDRPIGVETGEALARWAAGTNGKPENPEAPVLTTRLLDLATQLGARDQVATAIANNRRDHTAEPAKHVAWLKRQVRSAEGKVASGADKDVEL